MVGLDASHKRICGSIDRHLDIWQLIESDRSPATKNCQFGVRAVTAAINFVQEPSAKLAPS
jgi:hypothetical protein